jgi:hypothetical protein
VWRSKTAVFCAQLCVRIPIHLIDFLVYHHSPICPSTELITWCVETELQLEPDVKCLDGGTMLYILVETLAIDPDPLCHSVFDDRTHDHPIPMVGFRYYTY